MLFFPRGFKGGDVPDPDLAAVDFYEALKVISSTTQWQWKEGAIPSANYTAIEKKSHVAFDKVERGFGGVLGYFNPAVVGNYIRLPDSALSEPNVWKIPYNRGLSVIGTNSPATPQLSLSWTSPYPELLWSFLAFQFVRSRLSSMDPLDAAWNAFWLHPGSGRYPRVQVRIRLDGTPIPGTGPYADPVDGKYRGQGFGGKGCVALVQSVNLLSPGPHTLEGVAGQASCYNSDEDSAGVDEDSEEDQTVESGPGDRVCIGNSALFYVRFAKGQVVTGM